ncbi:MAG: cobalamin-dependent protein [Magnetococcus sp. DMHC-6]
MNQILLINPSIHAKTQSKRATAVMSLSFPTSIAVLAGYLLKYDFQPSLIDEQMEPLNDTTLQSLLAQLAPPRVVGISSVTLTVSRTQHLIRLVKKLAPDVTVIVGGIHATVQPDDFLQLPELDILVRGEGELTLREIMETLLSEKKDLSQILGISYRQGDKICHTPDRPLLKDLDELPPMPYHLFAKHKNKYSNFGIVFGSRGCPYPCTFCSARSISGLKYRFHSAQRIVDECKTLIDVYGQTLIQLADDNIAVHKRHFKEVCEGLIQEGLHKRAAFHGSLRGDDARDDVLEMAHQANFTIIYFGLETGSERLMQVIRKQETVAEVIDAIHRTVQHGIAVGTTIIFGLPSETRADRKACIRMVQNLPIASVRYNTLAPYPGTAIFNEYLPQNKILIKDGWENFNVQYLWQSDDIPYVPDSSDRLELIFDTMYANFAHYLSWHGIKQMFLSPVAGGNVVRLSSRWYTSLPELWKIYALFQYMMLRFLSVAVRMLVRRLFNVSKKST